MRLFRPTLLLSMLGTLTSCAPTPPLGPPGALLGSFGGIAAEINAAVDDVDVRYGCGLFRGKGPIVPDAAGNFVIELKPRPGNQSLSATLSGTTNGITIDFSVFTVYPDAQATSRFTVRKGVKAEYTLLSCTVPQG